MTALGQIIHEAVERAQGGHSDSARDALSQLLSFLDQVERKSNELREEVDRAYDTIAYHYSRDDY